MTEVKIISNPYIKKVSFEIREPGEEAWKPLNLATDAHSLLLKDRISKGFFPFEAKDIVETILADYYQSGGKLSLYFEGPFDEYQELSDLVKESEYEERIDLQRSEQYLDNARDILEETREIFDDLSPAVKNSLIFDTSIDKQLTKFSSAVSDQIPVVIFGNYSAGKSTFINALLGQEFLPAEDRPTTAFITEIKASSQSDTAKVSFKLDDKRVSIRLRDGMELKVSDAPNENGPILEKLLNETEEEQHHSLASRVCRILDVLNNLNRLFDKASSLGLVVKVEIPYKHGPAGLVSESLVFFDTPGSNTASNQNHVEALRQEMEEMSNGLCLVVGTYNSLDTVDNANLANSLKELDSLDHRFTVLVINQADQLKVQSVRMPDDLDQQLPRLLNTSLVYFVSSILGLGGMNGGEFRDPYYQEIYEDQYSKYSDPSRSLYRQLFKLNYLPEQISRKNSAACEALDNRILANSGLYSIILLLNEFAGKYAAYNKCSQAEHFLGELLEIVYERIEKELAEKERLKDKLGKEYEVKKEEVKKSVLETSSALKAEDHTKYEIQMDGCTNEKLDVFSKDNLKQIYEKYRTNERKEQEMRKTREGADAASSSTNLNQSAEPKSNPAPGISFDTLRKAAGNIGAAVNNARDAFEAYNQDRRDAATIAGNQLVNDINAQLPIELDKIMTEREQISAQYWLDRAANMKNTLLNLITESEELEDKDKEVLQQVILDYSQKIPFDGEGIRAYRESDCKFVYKLGWMVLEFADLSISNLNRDILKSSAGILHNHMLKLKSSHFQSYENWLNELISLLDSNLDSFNPTLKDKLKLIAEKQDDIDSLHKTDTALKNAHSQLDTLISWKTAAKK